MDITEPVLNDLAARIGQLTKQLVLATNELAAVRVERDAARAELAQLRAQLSEGAHGDD